MTLRPVIVGGSPGCGKTTLCRHLAQLDEKGVHLQTDHFFHYIAHFVDPSKPESKRQNEAVVNAYCAASRGYAEAGYLVYIDGVIGPWHHAMIASALGSFDYIMLHAPLSVALARVENRQTQASAHPSIVERMHPKFDSVIADYSDNLIRTDEGDADELVQKVLAKIQTGKCIVKA